MTTGPTEPRDLAPVDDPSLVQAGWDGDDIAEMQGDYDRDKFEAEFGRIVEQERTRRGWTAEQAAKRAGAAYKTWLRVEHGEQVRNGTLLKVDSLFGLPPGTALQCWQEQGDLRVEIEKAKMSGRTRDTSEQEDVIDRLVASIPPYGDAPVGDRVGYMTEIIKVIADAFDQTHRRRVMYEMIVTIANSLSDSDLDAVAHLLEVARVSRAEEKKLGVPAFSFSFEPDDEAYSKVVDPFVEYKNGAYNLKMIRSLTEAVQEANEAFRRESALRKEDPTDNQNEG